MSNASGSFFVSLLNWVQKILRRGAPVPATPPVAPPDNLTDPAVLVTNRVLQIVYDPVMDAASGERLSEKMKWNRVDDLVGGFIQDILETSGGLARYEVVERILLNEFPAKVDGYRYTPAAYLEVMHGAAPYKPEMINYQAILTGFNVLPRVAKGEIDEVWLFGFPHAGFYESCMGGAGAFWCNAPPLTGTAGCPRRFIVMGFSFERGVGEMLEAFGHRAESILSKVFEKTSEEANLYARFSRYDKIAPGKASVGTIHFAPNSQREYDWSNPARVMSDCDDWLNFPKFQGNLREVDASEWGGGDIRAHHRWWLAHLPKVAGRTAGVANNWWQYIMDPNRVDL